MVIAETLPFELKELVAQSRRPRYSLVEKIGSGTFGDVHQVYDHFTQQECALKHYTRTPERYRNKFTEYTRLPRAALKHPGVVDVLDFGILGDTPYVVMELVKGRKLDDLIYGDKEGKVNPELTWEYIEGTFSSLYSALHHLQKEELVHRDIRTGNIVGKKLVDLDSLRRGTTKDECITSDLRYFAPEELIGIQTHQTDIYHATAALYETLFGETPLQRALPPVLWDHNDLGLISAAHKKRLDLSAPREAKLAERDLWNQIFELGMHENMNERAQAKSLKKLLKIAANSESKAKTPIYGS